MLATQESRHSTDSPERPESPMFTPRLIERLFTKFALMWGNQFAAMWENIPPDDVKRCWSDELSAFTVEQVGIAVDKLMSEGSKFPPSLPDFLAKCQWAANVRPVKAKAFVSLPSRLHEDKQPQEWQIAKNVAQEIAKKLSIGAPSRDWAHKIIQRRDDGEIIPPAVLAKALAATGGV